MKIFLTYTLVLFSILFSNNIAVPTSSIYGRIIDEATGKPISNVNIYLANTTIGTTTNAKGYFEIKEVPQGTFDIIFSHVAYYFHKERLQLKHYYIDIGTVKLMVKAYQLPTVIVKGEERIWKDQYDKFVEEFIGVGKNSDSTSIIDPYKTNFWEKDEKLFASCEEPIKIINKSLGYEIKYFLDYFETCSDYTKFSGNSVFTSLSSSSKSDSVKWLENRNETYLGSFRHFLRALNEGYTKYLNDLPSKRKEASKKVRITEANSLLNTNGFFIYQIKELPWEVPAPFPEVPISINSLLTEGEIETERYLKFSNYLKVYYLPDYKEKKYKINYKIRYIPNVQISYIELEQDSVMVDIYGRYYDKFGIHTYGKFGQERISDMLPYEYTYPADR